jgi:hypothetical protein
MAKKTEKVKPILIETKQAGLDARDEFISIYGGKKSEMVSKALVKGFAVLSKMEES